MLNLTCPWVVGPSQEEARPCGTDAHALEVDVSTGEITAACFLHESRLGGGPGYVTILSKGPLHSTALFTR